MLGAYPRSTVERWVALVHDIVMKIDQKTRDVVQEDVFPDMRDASHEGKRFLGHTMTLDDGYVAQ